ncbi:MAG TPA: formylmethanofuran dehydrogenase subunit E family protein [Clostridia bacterium]|nr:formylmethanofuran dehydrogenase subunit E family protein [Clostridia bacterium]
MKSTWVVSLGVMVGAVFAGWADEPVSPVKNAQGVVVQSAPGTNAWNGGRAPMDWHGEIERYHGHVGPWNVLGWRIGQAALRELKSEWGKHELDVICYVPLQMPFTCLLDGLSVGTGNSPGRLDLRLAEVLGWRESFVAVCRKDGTGDILEFRPQAAYLKSILNQPVEKLEKLREECSQLAEDKLFVLQRVQR